MLSGGVALFDWFGRKVNPVTPPPSHIDARLTSPVLRGLRASNQTAAEFRPRGPDQASEWPVWVPSPPRRGKFAFRATLIDDKHLPLYEADSKPFTLKKAPGP